MNQCDGCRRGLPLENGVHIDPTIQGWGRMYMVCTKDEYDTQPIRVKHPTLPGYITPCEHGW